MASVPGPSPAPSCPDRAPTRARPVTSPRPHLAACAGRYIESMGISQRPKAEARLIAVAAVLAGALVGLIWWFVASAPTPSGVRSGSATAIAGAGSSRVRAQRLEGPLAVGKGPERGGAAVVDFARIALRLVGPSLALGGGLRIGVLRDGIPLASTPIASDGAARVDVHSMGEVTLAVDAHSLPPGVHGLAGPLAGSRLHGDWLPFRTIELKVGEVHRVDAALMVSGSCAVDTGGLIPTDRVDATVELVPLSGFGRAVSAGVDPAGWAGFTDLAPGRYRVLLHTQGRSEGGFVDLHVRSGASDVFLLTRGELPAAHCYRLVSASGRPLGRVHVAYDIGDGRWRRTTSNADGELELTANGTLQLRVERQAHITRAADLANDWVLVDVAEGVYTLPVSEGGVTPLVLETSTVSVEWRDLGLQEPEGGASLDVLIGSGWPADLEFGRAASTALVRARPDRAGRVPLPTRASATDLECTVWRDGDLLHRSSW